MLRALFDAERNFTELCRDESAWKSSFINYEKPHVERVWRPIGQQRLSLHRIHSCSPTESLFHPHSWPSAMRIISGAYEMCIGHGAGSEPPKISTRIILHSGCVYEMTDPDEWHSVRPLTESSYSVMLSGMPWNRSAPKSSTPLSPLTDAQRFDLFYTCRIFYRGSLTDRNGTPLYSQFYT